MPKDNPSVGSRIFLRTVRKTLYLHIKALGRVGYIAIATTLLAVTLLGVFSGFADTRVYAQTPNTTINYQARVLLSSGALVPDGDYHIEFKIYDDVSAGTTAQGVCTGNCLWNETRSTGNLVRVVNGYVSVNLGSVTAFPSSMPWSQNLYITMRIGGMAGSPAWDTEMTNGGNRMKTNGAPLAYVANNVASSATNAASTNSSNISIQTGNALGTTSNSGNITLDTGTATGTTGTITLGATNASALTLGRSGLTTTNAGALTVTQALTASSTLTLTTLGTTDNSTFICRNTSNILAGCNYTPLSSSLTDNITDAFDLQEGTNNYININTTNTTENISFGNATTNPSYNFLGSGTLTVAGNTQLNGNLTVAAGKYIALTGGNTASRPGSPTEGMVYFDSTTDSLLTYANGKWQSDRGEFVVVAANDSSQAEKDSADYVADGTADQTEINSALTEAAGGKVILLAGTYVANATILIPNNTTLAGAGRGTLIELADLDATDNLIENTDQTTGTGVTIRDIRIDGRDDLNTAGTQEGIYLLNMGGGTGPTARQGAKITNVIANNFRTDGVYLESSSNSTLSGNTFQGNFYGLSVYLGAYNTVTNNIAQGNSQLGFYIGTNNNTFTNNVAQGGETGFYTEQAVSNTISGNSTEGNSYVGYYVDDLSNSNIFTGNTSNTDEDYGFYIIGASTYNSFIGNSVRNSINGFRLENASNNNLISGNKIHDSGGATTNNGIYIDASDNNTITGNDISDTGCSTNCYAINIFNSTSDNNYLEGNTFTTSSGTATINDSGTGTRYANQTTAQNGLDILFKQSNSTTAFRIQDSTGGNAFTVNTTTLGISTGGTLAVTGNTTLTGDLAVNGNDITTGAGDLTITPAGGDTIVTGTLAVTTLGSADTSTFVCRNSSNQLATCSSSPLTNSLTDNITDAFDLQEGTNNYFNINTTNTTENISFGNATTNPSYDFLGSGTLSVGGGLIVDGTFLAGNSTINVDPNASYAGANGGETIITGQTQLTVNTSGDYARAAWITTASEDATVAPSGYDGLTVSSTLLSNANTQDFSTTSFVGADSYAGISGATSTTVGTVKAIQAQVGITSGVGSVITNASALYVRSSDVVDGSIVNGYGLYVENQTDATNDYGIYVAGADTYALFVDAGATRLDGTLEVQGLATLSAGLTVTGATTNLNASSNFGTNINTGTSTGAVAIGNSLAGVITLQSASTIGLTGTSTVTGLSAGAGTALTVNNSTSTGSIFVAQDNGTPVFTIADGGNISASGQLLVNGTGSNQSQLIVRANAGQTVANPLVLLQNSSSAELARINASTTSLYFGNAAGGNSAAGVNNTGIGASALGSVLTGTGNTTLGSGALASVSVNDNNTAVGYNAGNLATGGNNIFLGALAGDNVTTGTDNIIIGYNLDASASGATNELRIGGVLQGNTSTLAAQFNGALTVTGLLTGNLGATISGATTNINASSNFGTNINTGTSTGTLAIGNSLSTTTVLGATNINVTGATTTTIGNATSALNINGTTTIAAGLSQTGANTFSTGTGATSLNGATSVTGTNTLTVGTGLTSLGGGLNVTAGNTTLTADLAVNGNTSIGNATTDRLTVTSYILGANALVFEGATDGNGFATTLQVTDPTANNTIVLPNASGTILIAPAGSGNGLVQVPTSNSAGVAGANVISPTAASIVGLTVNGTTSTAAVALAVAQTGTATAMTVSQTQNNAGLTITANALTTANGLTVSSSGTGLTTGSLISVSSATTGAVATNGIVSLSATGNYTSTSNIGLLSVLANATQAGTIQNIQGNALTTGNALRISSTGTGLTTGSLFYGTSATTGAVATNGIFSLNATGNYTSTSNVGLLNIVANATTAGTVQQIQANALTTGDALNINSSGTGLTTGSLLRVSTATTGAIATDGAVSIQATGNYTSTSGIGLLSVLANTTQAGTVANIQANALTTGDALNISSTGTGLTTGSLLRVSTATTGAIATDGAVSIQATGNYTSTSNIGFVSIQANTTQAGTIQNIQGNALTSGQALYVSSSGTGLTTGSLFYGTSATTSAVATNGIFSLNATGNYTSTSNTGLLNVAANATTAGTITNIQGNALTTGTALNVTSTGTLTTTGNIATFTANSATTATGVVAINATGLTTGAALNVTASASTIALNTTGRAVITATANDVALGAAQSVVATATSTTNDQFGIYSSLTVTPGGASTRAYGALLGYATTASSNLSGSGATIAGFNGIAQYTGSGSLANALGGGMQVINLSTGTISNATALYIPNATNAGGGTITRAVGAIVANQTVGTTNINLLLGPTTAVGLSGNWSIYSNSAYDSSLLGNLRVGSNVAPTVALDVTGSGLITQSSNTNTLSVVNDSLTTATGTALTTTGVLTTTGNLLTLTANSATTATGVLTVNATGLTTGAGITVNTGTATALSAGGNITFQEVTGTRVLGVQTRTTDVTGTNLTVQSGQGGTTSAGGLLTLQGGSGGATSGNGGNVMLVGGTATSGTKGLVVVDTATFSAQTVQNFTANANITQASIDSFGSILISGNVAGWIATLTDPSNTTTGRVIYVTNSGSVDMTLAANTVGVALSITLKPASTATMYWNGVDWTAAGASSSTDLQAAYDNTATSAGGAEIVLSSTGTGGLTIRNDDGTAITGGLLEVQTSIGSSLFTVNNNATEYAANGGAESSTFTAWLPASGAPTETVARNTSDTGDIIATGTASASVLTTAVTGQGAENTLTAPLINGLKYQVSYAIKSSSTTGSFTELDTMYSYDGTAGNARHCVAGTAYYTTGTASQTTTTITGVGTTFTSAMVGMTFVFADGRSTVITGYTNPTTLTAGTSQNASSQNFGVWTAGYKVNSATWTRITCTFTAAPSGTTITASNSVMIRQTSAAIRTFYIDNLSVTVSADVNHAVDGSVDSALGSNWQAYDADGAAGTSTPTRDTTNIYDSSGAVADVTTAHINQGIRNNLTITPTVSTQYLVTFYTKLLSGTFTDITVGLLPAGGSAAPVTAQLCVDYNTRTLSTSTWTKITCIITTPSSGISDPDLVIYQPTATARTFYVDALSVTLNTNNSSNVQIGGGNYGGPTTLFTLDRGSTPPIAANNEAYLGSMYYDTNSGRIQCYEADGWGACGAAPDNIVNLNPEYAGAVLNGTGVGTMTADFCATELVPSTVLSVNTALCAEGEARNYYKWTSPQLTQQTYSVYVTYQLPATFNGFSSDDTIQLTARTDSTTNAAVTYEVFRSTGADVTACGTETTVVTTANTWQSVGINGNEATGCGFNSSAAGNFVIFKINMKANTNASAYVSTLSFVTTGR